MDNSTILNTFELNYRLLGEKIEGKWNGFLDIVGDDPQMLWTIGTTLVVIGVYWLYAGIYTIMDITNKPRFLRKYKIQPGINEPVDQAKLKKAIKQVLFNQTVVTIPAVFLLYHIGLKFMNTSNVRVLPSLPIFLRDLAIISVLEEIFFYYSHRGLHHKSIYKYIHKRHHEWTAPIAAITFYSHPIEHIVSNYLPVVISVLLTGAHIFTAWMFFAMAILNSMGDHTGYDFPFSPSSVRFHDLHHEKFNYNFGVFGWLDKYHGTYKNHGDFQGKSSMTAKKNFIKPKQIKKTK